jgi:hypothetical protein
MNHDSASKMKNPKNQLDGFSFFSVYVIPHGLKTLSADRRPRVMEQTSTQPR